MSAPLNKILIDGDAVMKRLISRGTLGVPDWKSFPESLTFSCATNESSRRQECDRF